MRQDELHPATGCRRPRKRIGRGDGSGHGTYSTRGIKGQKARSGGGVSPHFEGGQTPLVKRLPQKRGFVNIFRTEYAVVNVARLGRFKKNTKVTPEKLVESGLVKSLSKPIKVLGDGKLAHPLVVKANRFTGTARRKIEAAGGKVEEI